MTEDKSQIKQTPFTRFESGIIDQIFLRNFTKSEIKIILAIVRLSAGCSYGRQRFCAEISADVDFTFTGICKSNISEILRQLIADNIVIYEEKNAYYGINPYFEFWNRKYLADFPTEKIIKGKRETRKDLLDKVSNSNFKKLHTFYSDNKEFHFKMVKHFAHLGLKDKYIELASTKSLKEVLVLNYLNSKNLDQYDYYIGIKNKITKEFIQNVFKDKNKNNEILLNMAIHIIDVELILNKDELTDEEVKQMIIEKYKSFLDQVKIKDSFPKPKKEKFLSK